MQCGDGAQAGADIRQVAAVPVRRTPDGRLEVLLVTSRGTRRWIVPKGWPWRDCSEHQAAAEEAREEAGIIGRVHAGPLGSYAYLKRRQSGTDIEVTVHVFRLDVVELLDSWLEKDQRVRCWFSLEEAAEAVTEHDLKTIILGLARAP